MRIVTLVGIRKSGKTTTTEQLVRAIRARGKTVGTCKSIGCPAFSMDAPGSNTRRHMQSGANAVCARGKRETDLLFPGVLPLSRILQDFGDMDYVILEGDTRAPVSRLVAAFTMEDARERMNEKTIALVGKIATGDRSTLPLPAFDPLQDIEDLLFFIDREVRETDATDGLDDALSDDLEKKNRLFCAGCTHHAKDAVTVTVGGKPMQLTEAQKQTILSWAQTGCP
ncbi:MAG: molybdopterin-guanine dinucleotide biosynthesis protein MobB [Clostridia bacterium]|nr:molybdopterin-guanine dinucleotide biosynthesis protein MobB [Clostridia bacterium]